MAFTAVSMGWSILLVLLLTLLAAIITLVWLSRLLRTPCNKVGLLVIGFIWQDTVLILIIVYVKVILPMLGPCLLAGVLCRCLALMSLSLAATIVTWGCGHVGIPLILTVVSRVTLWELSIRLSDNKAALSPIRSLVRVTPRFVVIVCFICMIGVFRLAPLSGSI